MQRLVEDLLTLSTLESSPPPPMEESIDMARAGRAPRAPRRARFGRQAPHRGRERGPAAGRSLGSEKEISERLRQPGQQRRSATRPEGGTVRLRWRRADEGPQLRGRGHRHRHPRPSTSRGSPSASTASTAGARARPAARAWAAFAAWRGSSREARAQLRARFTGRAAGLRAIAQRTPAADTASARVLPPRAPSQRPGADALIARPAAAACTLRAVEQHRLAVLRKGCVVTHNRHSA